MFLKIKIMREIIFINIYLYFLKLKSLKYKYIFEMEIKTLIIY